MSSPKRKTTEWVLFDVLEDRPTLVVREALLYVRREVVMDWDLGRWSVFGYAFRGFGDHPNCYRLRNCVTILFLHVSFVLERGLLPYFQNILAIIWVSGPYQLCLSCWYSVWGLRCLGIMVIPVWTGCMLMSFGCLHMNLKNVQQIFLDRLVIIWKSWIRTTYFLNSSGSYATTLNMICIVTNSNCLAQF